MSTRAASAHVAQGRLAGLVSADGAVRSFRAVPYAQPPVGGLRWQLPLPPEPWDGDRPAVEFGPTAPQLPVRANSLYAGGHERQSEDCLTLNVWAPADGAGLPVMVWLHLGAFQFGGGSLPLYDGEALARAGVVLVTLNHRLGRLGFLSHPQLSAESRRGASGNYGLADQIEALRWLAENVVAFGGDPGRVTIFGLSAGSMSVSALMAAPLARGLFARAIGQSGALLGPVGGSTGVTDSLQDLEHAERSGVAFARALGARTIDELRRRPPRELMLAEVPPPADDRWVFDAVDAPFWRGALDGAFPSVDGHLLPESPYAAFAAGRQAPVPLVTGSVAGEGSGMPYMADAARFAADARAEYGEHAGAFLGLFPAGDDDEAARSSAAANGDRVFAWQNWAWARLHAASGAPAFYYHFAHEPPLPAGADVAERNRGAFHGCEIPYVFRHLGVRPWPWSAYDRELSDVISGHWLRFAAGGDPNGAGLPAWPRFDPAAPRAMTYGERAAAGPVPRRERLAFWDAHFERRRSEAPQHSTGGS